MFKKHDIVAFSGDFYRIHEPHTEIDGEWWYEMKRVSLDTWDYCKEAGKMMPVDYLFEGYVKATHEKLCAVRSEFLDSKMHGTPDGEIADAHSCQANSEQGFCKICGKDTKSSGNLFSRCELGTCSCCE